MVEIPDSLVERLKERQVILVAGLGCSELAGAPGWNDLTEALADRLVFSDARQVVARLTAAGRMTDAVAFIRDLGAAPAGRGRAGPRVPRGEVCTRRDDGVRAVPVARGGDHGVRRPVGAGAGRGGRRAAATGRPDGRRRSGAGAIVRTTAAAPRRPRRRCPRASASARETRASAWCRRRRWRGSRTWRAADRWCSSASGPPIRIWSGCRRGCRRGRREVPHFLFLDVSSDPDADTEVSVWGLRTGFDVIPCPEGTAEGVERLAMIATSIAAQLPPLDTDIDIGIWLDKWAQDPGNPQPREVLARVETALRDDERWDRLIELLLRRLDLQEDEDDQLAALRDVARIFRDKLARAGARADARHRDAAPAAERRRAVGQPARGRGGGGRLGAAGHPRVRHRPGGGTDAGGGADLARAGARAAREPGAPRRRAGGVPGGAAGRSGGSRNARRGGGAAARARALAGAGDASCTRRRASPTTRAARSRTCWRKRRCTRSSWPTRARAIAAYESVLAIDPDAAGGIAARALETTVRAARSAGPIWRACWSGGRCSRRRPRRSRCGGAAPSSWRRS